MIDEEREREPLRYYLHPKEKKRSEDGIANTRF